MVLSIFNTKTFFPYLLPFFSLIFPGASSLKIIVSPTSTLNVSTTVYWVPEATDPQLFDLRFVINDVDVGLAKANINIDSAKGAVGQDVVVFPQTGLFVLKAVSGPTYTLIGSSNIVNVTAAVVPTKSAVPTAPTNPSSYSPSPSAPPAVPSSKSTSRTPFIVGGIIGALLLAILIGLLLFLTRRRRSQMEDNKNKHLSFHADEMVQRRSRTLRASIFGRGVARASAAVTIVRGAPIDTPSLISGGPGIPQVRFSLASTVSQSLPDSTLITGSGNSGTVGRDLEAAAPNANAFLHVPSAATKPSSVKLGARALPPIPVGAAFPANAFAPRSPSPANPEPREGKDELRVPAAWSSTALPTFAPSSARSAKGAMTPARFLPPRSERQQLMDRRILLLKDQITILNGKVERNDIDPGVGKRVRVDLEKQVGWLEKNVEGGWAKGDEDGLPVGFARYMMP